MCITQDKYDLLLSKRDSVSFNFRNQFFGTKTFGLVGMFGLVGIYVRVGGVWRLGNSAKVAKHASKIIAMHVGVKY